ncbi:tetratricopeptide repeat protein [Aureibacter tunicatorum]|uniref:Sel1 repeat family protein n=1 Tax=Aureibacter tunicatorum TaxID=866807 RepID=A0AAE3XL56_9BACT|nr:tetratricopeptide repeat protein [Aureibacter tunicatorum]MDR6238535.1 hypothetical protein [Aureibacter tunicatorum]BDD05533.1 hypothetical protein AUTU_30160 [Aureibacter tunicatorum]
MSLNKNLWEELKQKSSNGDPDAQNDLAMWYEEGYNNKEFIIEKNLVKAAYWYLQSAKSGNPESQDAISRLLSLGQGVVLDIAKAKEWALKSIEQGNSTAAYNLGTIYRDQSNFEKAFEYYSLALKMGNKSALLQIGLCYYYGIGTASDYAKANKLFEQLTNEEQIAEREIDEANYYIGLAYLNGNGQDKSIQAARKHFLLANKDEDHEQASLILNLIGR